MPLPRLLPSELPITTPARALLERARPRAGVVPCMSIGKLKFADGWDSGRNNDYDYQNGPMTAQQIHDVLAEEGSDAMKEALECGILTVAKGCHQDHPKTHFTLNVEHNTKGVTSKCQNNRLFGSKGLHVDCWSGKVIST